MRLINLLCGWAKKRGAPGKATPPTTWTKNNAYKTMMSSGISPVITDAAVIARREARKRILDEQAKQLLGGRE